VPGKRNKLLPGENPLLIFVSSVINENIEDLQWARDVVRSVVGDTPFLRPWLFEYTPASSEEVSRGYLRKVREADFFVWLVGEKTTVPVRNEVREALRNGVRMLVFKLPAEVRTRDTQALLDEVGSRAKYALVSSRDSLGSEITGALNDELIRAVRQRPGTEPLSAWMDEQARRSRTRCIVGWVAAGVPYPIAASLADDPAVAPSLTRSFEEDERVRLIFGPLGAGKSLIANRLFQAAIQAYKNDHQESIPIYIRGISIAAGSSLEEALLAQLPTRGLPTDQGVFVVVDDITHLGIHGALRLVSEAQTLVDHYPHSCFTFTSREVPGLVGGWAHAFIKPLPEPAALELVNRLSGGSYDEIDVRYRWPQSIRASIQTPLFAVLLGNYLRSSSAKAPRSSVEMVSSTANRALERVELDERDLRGLLCKLARVCISQRNDMVAKHDVGPDSDIRHLVSTGLVTSEGNNIGFSLQLMLHWYGSLALGQRDPTPTEIVRGRAVLDSWYEPLLLLIRTGDYETVTEYLDLIAQHDPGYAANAVHEAIDRWPDDLSPALPPERECEIRIRSCMTSWIRGIGGIAKRIAPVDENGEVMPVRVKTDGNALRFAWYRGPAPEGRAPNLPRDIFGTGKEALKWRGNTFTYVPAQSAWPWRLTLESLRSNLTQLLGAYDLVPETGPGLHEAVWNCALSMLNHGSLRRDPLPLRLLRIPSHVPDETRMQGQLRGLRVGPFRRVIESYAAEGSHELPPPWPTADLRLSQRSGPILSTYSPERLKSRLEAIFAGALAMYRELVEKWFDSFATRLGVYSLMPVWIKGVLWHTPEDAYGKSVLFWYMRPIAAGDEDSVEISLGDPRVTGSNHELLNELHVLSNECRPERGRFASVSTHFTDASVFVHSYPITNLAYEWLWEDLERLKWVEGMHRTLY